MMCIGQDLLVFTPRPIELPSRHLATLGFSLPTFCLFGGFLYFLCVEGAGRFNHLAMIAQHWSLYMMNNQNPIQMKSLV